MTAGRWAALLASHYEDLRRRLSRRLGSEESAADVLHETFVHLSRQEGSNSIENPAGYLYRSALNLAESRRRSDSRRLDRDVAYAELELGGEVGPEPSAEGALELEALKRAMALLPKRRRAILLAARVEDLPHAEIARRLGISRRLVLLELRKAVAFCREQLDHDPQPGIAQVAAPWRSEDREGDG